MDAIYVIKNNWYFDQKESDQNKISRALNIFLHAAVLQEPSDMDFISMSFWSFIFFCPMFGAQILATCFRRLKCETQF